MCTGDAMRLCGHEVPNSRESPPAWPGPRACQSRLPCRMERDTPRGGQPPPRVTGCVARRRQNGLSRAAYNAEPFVGSVAIRAAIDLAIDSWLSRDQLRL